MSLSVRGVAVRAAAWSDVNKEEESEGWLLHKADEWKV